VIVYESFRCSWAYLLHADNHGKALPHKKGMN
jgi:hypothetical protein